MDEIDPMRTVPVGFGMALAQNPEALSRFAMLSPEERQQVVAAARAVRSKQEMQAYVNKLGG